MEHATQVLRTHPRKPAQSLEECLKACFDCEAACTACADACLHEKPEMLGMLVKCIDLDLDCGATGRLIARAGGADPAVTRAQLQACIAACKACEAECQKHASMHEHCKHCAEACRACAQACEQAMQGVKQAA